MTAAGVASVSAMEVLLAVAGGEVKVVKIVLLAVAGRVVEILLTVAGGEVEVMKIVLLAVTRGMMEVLLAIAVMEVLLAVAGVKRIMLLVKVTEIKVLVKFSSTNTLSAVMNTMRTTMLSKVEVEAKIMMRRRLAITRLTLLKDNGVFQAVSRGGFAVSKNRLATDCALFITNAMNSFSLSKESVSSVKINILDLIVLSKFNISAWNIKSMDVTVTMSMTNTVSMTVAVFSVVRNMIVRILAVAMRHEMTLVKAFDLRFVEILTVNAMRLVINLAVAARLVVNLTIAAASVRLVNKILLGVAVNKVGFLGGVAFDVRLMNNLASVRPVNALSLHGLIRHALLADAGAAAAARLFAGFAFAAAGRIIMRVVSVETTFVEASVLGLVLIEAAAAWLVGIEAAALGFVIIEAAVLGSVVIVAAALGLVNIVAAVRVGSVGILNLVDNVHGLDRVDLVSSALLLGPRVVVAAMTRAFVMITGLRGGNQANKDSRSEHGYLKICLLYTLIGQSF